MRIVGIDWSRMGRFFQERREELGINRTETASIIGVTSRTIQNIEGGRTATDLHTILKLCDLYDLSITALDDFFIRV